MHACLWPGEGSETGARIAASQIETRVIARSKKLTNGVFCCSLLFTVELVSGAATATAVYPTVHGGEREREIFTFFSRTKKEKLKVCILKSKS